jgi:hypothetical protein
MHDYSPSPARPRPWPAPPGQEPEPQDQERIFAGAQATDRAAVAEIISITSDTRRLTHLSGTLLGAVLAGAATVAGTLLVRGHLLAVGTVALLIPLSISWLVTAALVLRSEGPLTGALAELRWATRAPVDPAAPWAPLGVRPCADSEVTWDYIAPLIAATRRQHERTRRALSAAVLTAAAFLAWMVLSLTMAAPT